MATTEEQAVAFTNQLDMTSAFCFNRAVPEVSEASLAGLMASTADGLEALLTEYTGVLKNVDTNRNYTAVGKIEARRSLVPQVATKLTSLKAPLENLQNAITHGESILSAAIRHRIPQTANADDWRALEGEVRRKVEALDPVERNTIYLQAARDGDTLTVRAIEQAPAAFRLISEDTIAEGAELYAAATQPEAYGLLQQQRAALAHINGDFTRAANIVSRMVGNSLTDPTESVNRMVADAA